MVASKVTALAGNRRRYDYAVYNMVSDRGIGSFSVPVGTAAITNATFKAPRSHGEAWSNDAWTAKVEGGRITWSTAAHATNPNANAIRWGTVYSFSFETDAAPVAAEATLGRFKPGTLGGATLTAGGIEAPAAR